MPIYEYVCRKCSHAFEHLSRTLSEPAPKCPKCGTAKPAKQLSSFSARVGGQGLSPCADGACPVGSCPSSQGCSGGKCPLG